MKFDEKITKISKAYYNKGLECTLSGDLSGAVEYLKCSLRFDKYRTEARNLLGLILYETGETADALVQWVVSINLEPKNNDADRYLDEIQRKAGVLAGESSIVKRFNQALESAGNGGEDFAVIELRDIVKKKPNFIKAELLLAILYMHNGDNVKAGKALMSVLDIDRNNPQATRLFDEVKKLTGRAEVERARFNDAYSHRGLENDDVIIPRVKSGFNAGSMILHLFAGVLIGLAGFYLLILPTVRRSYNQTLNENIIRNSDIVSELSSSYAELEEKYAGLQSDYEEVSSRLTAYEQDNLDFTAAYETLNSIINACASGDYVDAAESYTALNRDNITAEPLISLLNEADRVMLNDAFNAIAQMGTDNWNGGNKTASESYYRLALSVKPDDPEVMFLLARLLQSENRISDANALFDKIVGEHPESSYAERSVEARGY